MNKKMQIEEAYGGWIVTNPGMGKPHVFPTLDSLLEYIRNYYQ